MCKITKKTIGASSERLEPVPKDINEIKAKTKMPEFFSLNNIKQSLSFSSCAWMPNP